MIETYKKMWRFMENKKPAVFTTTYEEGIRRVLEGNYAFLMESTMLDYIVQRDCNLTQIGGLLDTKGFCTFSSPHLCYFIFFFFSRINFTQISINYTLLLFYPSRVWYCNANGLTVAWQNITGHTWATRKGWNTNVVWQMVEKSKRSMLRRESEAIEQSKCAGRE